MYFKVSKSFVYLGCVMQHNIVFLIRTPKEIVKKHVPHKIAKTKESLPWLTPDIRKLIRKRDRLKSRKRNLEIPPQQRNSKI